jgi:hypothetical protein
MVGSKREKCEEVGRIWREDFQRISLSSVSHRGKYREAERTMRETF